MAATAGPPTTVSTAPKSAPTAEDLQWTLAQCTPECLRMLLKAALGRGPCPVPPLEHGPSNARQADPSHKGDRVKKQSHLFAKWHSDQVTAPGHGTRHHAEGEDQDRSFPQHWPINLGQGQSLDGGSQNQVLMRPHTLTTNGTPGSDRKNYLIQSIIISAHRELDLVLKSSACRSQKRSQHVNLTASDFQS